LNPTTTIGLNDQIVIEIPTKSIDGTSLFANDLGLTFNNNQWIPIDILSGQINTFMTCSLFHGDQTNGKNTKIICGGFTSSIVLGTTLTFAFKVKNPLITVQASIPFIIYSQDISNMIKTNYMLV
jgi:hypothetical protein